MSDSVLFLLLKQAVEEFQIDEGIYNYSFHNDALENIKNLEAKRESLFGVQETKDLFNLLEGRHNVSIKTIYEAGYMLKQTYYAYKNGTIAITRNVALALGIAYHLEDKDFEKFMAFFGFVFPETYTDAIVSAFIKSDIYRKYAYDNPNGIRGGCPVQELNEEIYKLQETFRNKRYIKIETIGTREKETYEPSN